jgi:hypothetical protein
LTLPLQPPSEDDSSIQSKASSAFSRAKLRAKSDAEIEETKREAEESSVEDEVPWEKRADAGERVSQIDPQTGPSSTSQSSVHSKKKKSSTDQSSAKNSKALHEPEMGEPADDEAVEFDAKAPALSVVFLLHSAQPLSYISSLIEAEGPGFGEDSSVPPRVVTFHSRSTDSKRWSPATSIGDFLQDAARE